MRQDVDVTRLSDNETHIVISMLPFYIIVLYAAVSSQIPTEHQSHVAL